MIRIIFILIMACFISAACVSAGSESGNTFGKDSGFACKGMNKKQLCAFFMDAPVACRKKGNDEWITFDNWTSGKKGDVVIFHLENNIVVDYEKSG